MGIHVYEVLKFVKKLPVIGVVTSANLSKDKIRIPDPTKFPVMDKVDMVRWMLIQKEERNLLFPVDPTPEIIELQRQLSIFEESKTKARRPTYSAPEGEHDDLVSALILDCWLARERFLQIKKGPILYGARSVYAGSGYEDVMTTEATAAEKLKNKIENRVKRIPGVTNYNVDVKMPE